MPHDTPPIPSGRSGASRTLLFVTGALAALFAVCLLGLGALTLWGDSRKDDRGYLTDGSHRYAASTHALTSESLDIDLGGADWIADATDLGDIRLRVDPESAEPVFVGIARTTDVSAYLRNVAHTSVTDVELAPFTTRYRTHAGERRPVPPGQRPIWVASAQGEGAQELTWDVRDGEWSVVVMNADGSRGISADVDAGAKVPLLAEIGWSSLGGGMLFLILATTLTVLAFRTPRNRPRPGAPGAPGIAPVAT